MLQGCSQLQRKGRQTRGDFGGKGADVGTERQVVTGRWRHVIESDDDVP
jgi:hypothetical protein